MREKKNQRKQKPQLKRRRNRHKEDCKDTGYRLVAPRPHETKKKNERKITDISFK